ncbi:hypothetical protein PV04_10609 [Phialophora macrospora]|uniref:MYND-type domain-containing protein n=1 Tax=Phialophora macrospora TaxID=1851006 RepID=A0A0D2CBQ2_9EURO|nr:hypothetical protein PV04_10609 [Phialophora macrospora]
MSSQNSSQTITSYCFRCQHRPGPEEVPLKRCARCRARHYCSTDCQRNDWPRHKQECRVLADGGEAPTRNRTTMRLTGLPGHDESARSPDPDVIYYLKTSKPHMLDVSISGPYYPLDEVLDQLHARMEIEGSTGGDTLDDLVSSGAFPNVEHFNAPLPDGNIMKFQLLRERNRDVVRALPCKVWNVSVACPNMGVGDSGPGSRYPPVEDMEMRGTFLTLQAANTEAERVLGELKAEAGTSAVMQKSYRDGLVEGFVVSSRGRTARAKAVQVRCDDGQIQQVDRSGNPIHA